MNRELWIRYDPPLSGRAYRALWMMREPDRKIAFGSMGWMGQPSERSGGEYQMQDGWFRISRFPYVGRKSICELKEHGLIEVRNNLREARLIDRASSAPDLGDWWIE